MPIFVQFSFFSLDLLFEDFRHLNCHYRLSEVRIANGLFYFFIPDLHDGLEVQPHLLMHKTLRIAFLLNQVLEVHALLLNRNMRGMDCFEEDAEGFTGICHGVYIEVAFFPVEVVEFSADLVWINWTRTILMECLFK